MRDALRTLSDDEHPRSRRCRSCTATNLALILALATAATAVWWPVTLAFTLGIGITLLFRGTLSSQPFRGALDQGTPRIVLVTLLLLLSGDGKNDGGPPTASGALSGDDDGERVLVTLLEAGVLHEDEKGLLLDESFRTRWRAEMEAVRGDGLVAAVREVTPDGVERVDEVTVDTDWVVLSNGTDAIESETWLARHVAIAEVAAVRALGDWDGDGDVPTDLRAAAATPLRAFLLECPVCDGPVEQTTSGCCCGGSTDPEGPAEDDILACTVCDQRLHTF